MINLTSKVISNLDDLIPEIPSDSIVSRTIYKDPKFKAVLFGFAPEQALSEHSAAQTAVIHILQGDAFITVDGEIHEAHPGTWVHMPPRLRHSVVARTPLKMLLLLITEDGNHDEA